MLKIEIEQRGRGEWKGFQREGGGPEGAEEIDTGREGMLQQQHEWRHNGEAQENKRIE